MTSSRRCAPIDYTTYRTRATVNDRTVLSHAAAAMAEKERQWGGPSATEETVAAAADSVLTAPPLRLDKAPDEALVGVYVRFLKNIHFLPSAAIPIKRGAH